MFLFCDAFRVIEMKLKEACEKLKSLQKPKSASEYSDDDDDILFDLGMARLNLWIETGKSLVKYCILQSNA